MIISGSVITEVFTAIKYRYDISSKAEAHRGGSTAGRFGECPGIGRVVKGNKCIINIVPVHLNVTDSGLTSPFSCISLPGINGTSGSRSRPRPEWFGSWFSSGSRRSGKRIAEGCSSSRCPPLWLQLHARSETLSSHAPDSRCLQSIGHINTAVICMWI